MNEVERFPVNKKKSFQVEITADKLYYTVDACVLMCGITTDDFMDI